MSAGEMNAQVKSLKAGTLEVIVISLSDDQGALDPNVMHILLSTYRSFATCDQLLKAITTRYQHIDEGVVQVSSILATFVFQYLSLDLLIVKSLRNNNVLFRLWRTQRNSTRPHCGRR